MVLLLVVLPVIRSRFHIGLLAACLGLLFPFPMEALAQQARVYEGEYLVQESEQSSFRSAARGTHVYLALDSSSGLSRSSNKRKLVSYDRRAHREFCRKLRKEKPSIRFCEPNAELRIQTLSNDPISQESITKISAPSAWNITTGSNEIIVSILDTGGDYLHEDLKDNVWINTAEIPGDGIDNDKNGFVDDIHGIDLANLDSDPMDDNGHGTHVAGTIGARGNNGTGVSGVAWNVKLQFIKFIGSDGAGSTFSAVKGIEYAVASGAHVINASWGGPFASEVLRESISAAQSSGVIFVTAAGNSANDNDLVQHYPAGYGAEAGLNVIAVAASDKDDQLAFFSNFGKHSVHIAAPGVQIASTLPGNNYGTLSGTSMAAPHVAGAIALMLSHRPELSFQQVKQGLLSSGDVLSDLVGSVSSGARLNVHRALTNQAEASALQPLFLSRVPGRMSRKLIAGRTLYFGFAGQAGEVSSGQFILESGSQEQVCSFPVKLDSNGFRLLRTRLHLEEGVKVDQARLLGQYGASLSQPVKSIGHPGERAHIQRTLRKRSLKRSCKRITKSLRTIPLQMN